MTATNTLIVIPCSKQKKPGGDTQPDGRFVLKDLPKELAEELTHAREKVARLAGMTKLELLPAWQRYSGFLYQTAQHAIKQVAQRHLLIMSGGYGIVHAAEPVRNYDRSLRITDWPGDLLHRVIGTYARKHALSHAVFFASDGSNYAKIFRCPFEWGDWGLSDVTLYTPGRLPAKSGAQIKGPVALGEGLIALLNGQLNKRWESRHKISLIQESLA